jgi:hypothetical protein
MTDKFRSARPNGNKAKFSAKRRNMPDAATQDAFAAAPYRADLSDDLTVCPTPGCIVFEIEALTRFLT